MPKLTHIQVQLPGEQPDYCSCCPLCGLIPQKERPRGSREPYVCLGTQEAMTEKGIIKRRSEADKKHPFHRPCDQLWHQWLQFSKQCFPLNATWYNQYRVPYEQQQQMTIKFHFRGRPANI